MVEGWLQKVESQLIFKGRQKVVLIKYCINSCKGLAYWPHWLGRCCFTDL